MIVAWVPRGYPATWSALASHGTLSERRRCRETSRRSVRNLFHFVLPQCRGHCFWYVPWLLFCFTIISPKSNIYIGTSAAGSTEVSCNQALQLVRNVRGRLTGSGEALEEHKMNFAPYKFGKKRKNAGAMSHTVPKKKCVGRSENFFCPSDRDAQQVPSSVAAREVLVEAGLGPRQISIPDVECSPEVFRQVIIDSFPKLASAGGFELMRCVANSKVLEAIYIAVYCCVTQAIEIRNWKEPDIRATHSARP